MNLTLAGEDASMELLIDNICMGTAPKHLILYDGVCGLCNRLVAFVLARDPGGVFHFAALQGPLGRKIVEKHGGRPDALDTFYMVRDYRSVSPVLLGRAQAALAVATELGAPWSWVSVCGVLPDALLNSGYDLIARHRYRIFGRLESCPLPKPEYRARFDDDG